MINIHALMQDYFAQDDYMIDYSNGGLTIITKRAVSCENIHADTMPKLIKKLQLGLDKKHLLADTASNMEISINELSVLIEEWLSSSEIANPEWHI